MFSTFGNGLVRREACEAKHHAPPDCANLEMLPKKRIYKPKSEALFSALSSRAFKRPF